jgi:anthranilate phosphoribosyltransferase
MVGGETGPYRDIVLFNAAGALIVAGKVTTLTDGVAMAAASIDEGRAAAALDKLVKITNSTIAAGAA